jgi:hypothetical protein
VEIVDPPPLACDDITVAVRLRLQEPPVGHHAHSMAPTAATQLSGPGRAERTRLDMTPCAGSRISPQTA